MSKNKSNRGLLEQLTEFIDGLKPLDRMNFEALINLPQLPELLEKMPDGQYKKMVLIAVAAKIALKQSGAPA